MKSFNLFYIILVILGIAFAYFLKGGQTEVLSFFGVAESNETEVNYNYPIVVNEILVQPGQVVKKDDILLRVSRVKSKETLSDQSFRIDEVNAEIVLLKQKKSDAINEENQRLKIEQSSIDEKIAELKKELAYKTSLVDNLDNVDASKVSYKPIEDKISNLQASKARILQLSEAKVSAIRNELELSIKPFQKQIARMNAEYAFDESQKEIPLTVVAPSDGLIGNIFCKEAEHVPSYKTLLSFYEPHSSIIKGYVHEDLTLKVNVGDLFSVSSIKDFDVSYQGKVVGLGSRIVEIPARLRKMEELKTYGREVLIEIDSDNSFLQKEKVAVSRIYG